MKQQRVYETPLSEILCIAAQDVVTASGFSEENREEGTGWNNNGNGNSNGHWFEEKPGNGDKKDK